MAKNKPFNKKDKVKSEDEEQIENEDIITEEFKVSKEEYDKLVSDAEELQKSVDSYKDMYQRLMAEFDNYKKRTIKERETNRLDAKLDVITKFLPVIDNMERARLSFQTDASVESIQQGTDMVFKQIMDVMEAEDVTAIESLGEEFNPDFHEAVMHIEDDSCDTNVIVEEFQRGYMCKDKVIRHSMVKVAN